MGNGGSITQILKCLTDFLNLKLQFVSVFNFTTHFYYLLLYLVISIQ